MYPWIWRHLPGPTWAKIIECIVILLAITLVIFIWVFPWVVAVTHYGETTVN